MKEYKRVDIIIQLILIVLQPLGALMEAPLFFPCIILLGLAQLISTLTHIRWGAQPWKSKMRVIYHWSLLIPVALVVWAILDTSEESMTWQGLEQMIYLLMVSAVMALFYLVICIIEFVRMKKVKSDL
jgi:hypothetical protein